jgi:hypothetical protein
LNRSTNRPASGKRGEAVASPLLIFKGGISEGRITMGALSLAPPLPEEFPRGDEALDALSDGSRKL